MLQGQVEANSSAPAFTNWKLIFVIPVIVCILYEADAKIELGVQECHRGASLVAQWLRIHLPVHGTQVRALVWEDPTCRGATKPGRLNY